MSCLADRTDNQLVALNNNSDTVSVRMAVTMWGPTVAAARDDVTWPGMDAAGRYPQTTEPTPPSKRQATLMIVCLKILIFFITLLSALKQTHCTLVACDSERVTVAFYHGFIYRFKLFTACFWIYPSKWCTYSALTSYVAGATSNCSALSAMPLTSCKATYVGWMRVSL